MLPCCTTSAIGALHWLANNIPLDTIQNIRSPSICLHVQIVHNGTKIDALALLDSRAEGNYANIKFIEKHKIPTFNHATNLQMEMADLHQESMEIAITNTGNHNILLGTDWLKTHNPSIDWKTSRIWLDQCPSSCVQDLLYTT